MFTSGSDLLRLAYLFKVVAIVLSSSLLVNAQSDKQARKCMPHIKEKSQVKLHHEVHGSGAPILLIHGFGASTYAWRHLIEPLSKDRKVIVIDLKGFGASPKPHDNNYSIKDQSNLIYQFILEHDLKNLILVGHSLGGGVALFTILKLYDQQQSHRLASLVLIDTIGYPQRLPGFIRALRTPVLGWLGLHLLPSEDNVRSILKLTYYDDSKITKEQVKAYAKPIGSPGGKHALRQTAKQVIPPDIKEISARYSIINVPTLILWGRQDKIIPLKIGERLHQAIPKSQLVVIDQCGHAPHEEKPDEVIKAISTFLIDQSKHGKEGPP